MNYIGIDLGGTNIKGALVSAEGEILKEHSIPTRVDLGPEAVAGRIGQIIAQLSIGEDTVGGVGVGCPGTVDDASGIVRFAANLNFINFDLTEENMLIQWYPGHMAKARRQLTESLKLIDVVVEIVDARAPRATRNPDFDGLFKDKKRVVLLNKSDLASPALTKAWITEYKKNGIESIEFVATNSAKKKAALELMENAAKEKVEKSLAKGVKKTVRAMIVA